MLVCFVYLCCHSWQNGQLPGPANPMYTKLLPKTGKIFFVIGYFIKAFYQAKDNKMLPTILKTNYTLILNKNVAFI